MNLVTLFGSSASLSLTRQGLVSKGDELRPGESVYLGQVFIRNVSRTKGTISVQAQPLVSNAYITTLNPLLL